MELPNIPNFKINIFMINMKKLNVLCKRKAVPFKCPFPIDYVPKNFHKKQFSLHFHRIFGYCSF